MSDIESVLYAVENRVATISLNRPDSLNSFNMQMRKELLAAINKANNDDNVRVVVINSAGRIFSAGADLAENYKEHHNEIEGLIVEEYKPFLMAIYNSPKLFISSVQGAAAGIGSALAMTCDLTIMEDSGCLYMAFAAIALVPDGGASWYLVNSLGYKRALEMIVESEKIPAQTCLELGLINRVVPADELVSAAQSWAEKLAAGAPLAQKYSKEILQKVPQLSLSDAIDLESKCQNVASTSEDYQEGATAFFEKRTPFFSGR